jgi:alkanesulfonate monooxygenase SsuD/methylene tetrahydromethanopterin reductase-like flavin-dependent oxidoreductase (luciferase family)
VFNGIHEDVVRASMAALRAGAEEAGRSYDDLDVIWPVIFHLADTVAQGVDEVKFSLAGTANRAFRHSLHDKLVPEQLHDGFRGLQAEYQSSRHQQLHGHEFNASLVDKWGLTDYLAERFTVVGPPSHCIERLQQISSYGVKRVTLSLNALDLPGQIAMMHRIADEIFPHVL